MPHDVVISYSRRIRDVADLLVAQLRERGLAPWYDRMIKPGADWRDEIANAITDARIFLILFSAESNDSQELRKELAIADRHKLLIVPVRVEDVQPKGMFEYELARRQWFDIFPDWRNHLPGVVDHIVEAVEATKPAVAPSATGAPSAASAPTEARTEPQREPVAPQIHARADRLVDAVTAVPSSSAQDSLRILDWLAFVLLVAVAVIGLVNAATSRPNELSEIGAASIMFVGPFWLALQTFLAWRAGADRSFPRSALVAASIAAIIGVVAGQVALSGETDFKFMPWIGMIGAALGLLALIVAIIIRKKQSWFWIGPLLATSLIIFSFVGLRDVFYYNQYTNTSVTSRPDVDLGQVTNGIGLILGSLVYCADIVWRRLRKRPQVRRDQL